MRIETVYILKSLFAVRTPHAVFMYEFMLLCTLMPSIHNLKCTDSALQLYMFQRPKVNIGGFKVKC